MLKPPIRKTASSIIDGIIADQRRAAAFDFAKKKAVWNPEDHPRWPMGTPGKGGQFMNKWEIGEALAGKHGKAAKTAAEKAKTNDPPPVGPKKATKDLQKKPPKYEPGGTIAVPNEEGELDTYDVVDAMTAAEANDTGNAPSSQAPATTPVYELDDHDGGNLTVSEPQLEKMIAQAEATDYAVKPAEPMNTVVGADAPGGPDDTPAPGQPAAKPSPIAFVGGTPLYGDRSAIPAGNNAGFVAGPKPGQALFWDRDAPGSPNTQKVKAAGVVDGPMVGGRWMPAQNVLLVTKDSPTPENAPEQWDNVAAQMPEYAMVKIGPMKLGKLGDLVADQPSPAQAVAPTTPAAPTDGPPKQIAAFGYATPAATKKALGFPVYDKPTPGKFNAVVVDPKNDLAAFAPALSYINADNRAIKMEDKIPGSLADTARGYIEDDSDNIILQGIGKPSEKGLELLGNAAPKAKIMKGGVELAQPKEGVSPPAAPVAPASGEPDPAPKPATPAQAWPDLSNLKPVKSLGGSTGAMLMEDKDTGERYVQKKGKNAGHLREEAAADDLYRAAGINVPESNIYETPEGPVKLARFVEGTTMDQLAPSTKEAVKDELRKGFAVDALIGNWDVVGLSEDNVMLGEDGKVYRIDNGGSLRYRAQGALKAAGAFGPEVGELQTMRDPKMTSGKVFGSLSNKDVAGQVHQDLLPKRDALLAAAPPEIKTTISQRLDALELFAKKNDPLGTPAAQAAGPAAPPATPPASAPSGTPTAFAWPKGPPKTEFFVGDTPVKNKAAALENSNVYADANGNFGAWPEDSSLTPEQVANAFNPSGVIPEYATGVYDPDEGQLNLATDDGTPPSDYLLAGLETRLPYVNETLVNWEPLEDAKKLSAEPATPEPVATSTPGPAAANHPTPSGAQVLGNPAPGHTVYDKPEGGATNRVVLTPLGGKDGPNQKAYFWNPADSPDGGPTPSNVARAILGYKEGKTAGKGTYDPATGVLDLKAPDGFTLPSDITLGDLFPGITSVKVNGEGMQVGAPDTAPPAQPAPTPSPPGMPKQVAKVGDYPVYDKPLENPPGLYHRVVLGKDGEAYFTDPNAPPGDVRATLQPGVPTEEVPLGSLTQNGHLSLTGPDELTPAQIDTIKGIPEVQTVMVNGKPYPLDGPAATPTPSGGGTPSVIGNFNGAALYDKPVPDQANLVVVGEKKAAFADPDLIADVPPGAVAGGLPGGVGADAHTGEYDPVSGTYVIDSDKPAPSPEILEALKSATPEADNVLWSHEGEESLIPLGNGDDATPLTYGGGVYEAYPRPEPEVANEDVAIGPNGEIAFGPQYTMPPGEAADELFGGGVTGIVNKPSKYVALYGNDPDFTAIKLDKLAKALPADTAVLYNGKAKGKLGDLAGTVAPAEPKLLKVVKGHAMFDKPVGGGPNAFIVGDNGKVAFWGGVSDPDTAQVADSLVLEQTIAEDALYGDYDPATGVASFKDGSVGTPTAAMLSALKNAGVEKLDTSELEEMFSESPEEDDPAQAGEDALAEEPELIGEVGGHSVYSGPIPGLGGQYAAFSNGQSAYWSHDGPEPDDALPEVLPFDENELGVAQGSYYPEKKSLHLVGDGGGDDVPGAPAPMGAVPQAVLDSIAANHPDLNHLVYNSQQYTSGDILLASDPSPGGQDEEASGAPGATGAPAKVIGEADGIQLTDKPVLLDEGDIAGFQATPDGKLAWYGDPSADPYDIAEVLGSEEAELGGTVSGFYTPATDRLDITSGDEEEFFTQSQINALATVLPDETAVRVNDAYQGMLGDLKTSGAPSPSKDDVLATPLPGDEEATGTPDTPSPTATPTPPPTTPQAPPQPVWTGPGHPPGSSKGTLGKPALGQETFSAPAPDQQNRMVVTPEGDAHYYTGGDHTPSNVARGILGYKQGKTAAKGSYDPSTGKVVLNGPEDYPGGAEALAAAVVKENPGAKKLYWNGSTVVDLEPYQAPPAPPAPVLEHNEGTLVYELGNPAPGQKVYSVPDASKLNRVVLTPTKDAYFYAGEGSQTPSNVARALLGYKEGKNALKGSYDPASGVATLKGPDGLAASLTPEELAERFPGATSVNLNGTIVDLPQTTPGTTAAPSSYTPPVAPGGAASGADAAPATAPSSIPKNVGPGATIAGGTPAGFDEDEFSGLLGKGTEAQKKTKLYKQPPKTKPSNMVVLPGGAAYFWPTDGPEPEAVTKLLSGTPLQPYGTYDPETGTFHLQGTVPKMPVGSFGSLAKLVEGSKVLKFNDETTVLVKNQGGSLKAAPTPPGGKPEKTTPDGTPVYDKPNGTGANKANYYVDKKPDFWTGKAGHGEVSHDPMENVAYGSWDPKTQTVDVQLANVGIIGAMTEAVKTAHPNIEVLKVNGKKISLYEAFNGNESGPMAKKGLKEKHLFFKQAYKNTMDGLPKGQKNALSSYRGNGYQVINKALRQNYEHGTPLSANQKTMMNNIDKAIQTQKTNTAVNVHRGLGSPWMDAFIAKAGGPKKLTGHVLPDGGFMSTSLDPKRADQFSHGPKYDVSVHFVLPPGTPAVYMDAMDEWSSDELFDNGWENELVLPRGMKLKVKSVNQESNRRVKLMVEVVKDV